MAKHREDEVGSLRWSDTDCLMAERMRLRIAEVIEQKRKKAQQ